MTLVEVMDEIAVRCFKDISKKPRDWEFQLYRLVEQGFNSFFKYKLPGMLTEDMTMLRRISGIEANSNTASWSYVNKPIRFKDWLVIYNNWKNLNINF